MGGGSGSVMVSWKPRAFSQTPERSWGSYLAGDGTLSPFQEPGKFALLSSPFALWGRAAPPPVAPLLVCEGGGLGTFCWANETSDKQSTQADAAAKPIKRTRMFIEPPLRFEKSSNL